MNRTALSKSIMPIYGTGIPDGRGGCGLESLPDCPGAHSGNILTVTPPETSGGLSAELTATLDGQDLHVHVKSGQNPPGSYDGCRSSGAFLLLFQEPSASCMAHLDEGEVIMDFAPALDKSEIDDGYILTCQAKAKSSTLKITY